MGIVGSGGMGRVHARQYRKRNDVELSFFDRNSERSSKFRTEFDSPGHDSFDQLVRSVDIVDICLPTPSHHEFGMRAISAGRAVLMEKPLALTLEQAEALAEAATVAKVPFMPAHVVRFFPEYRTAHRIVTEGRIGNPSAFRMRRGGGAPQGSEGWFTDIAKSGGVLLDLSIHDFDWLRWTLGPVKTLYSRSLAQNRAHGPDYALTTLTFENGCIAQVEGTWMDPGGFRTTFDLAGSGGLIQHDSRQNAALRTCVAPDTQGAAQLPNLEGALFDRDDPYYQEIDAFLTSIATGATQPITALDGLQAVAISTAAIQSARTHHPTTPATHF